MDIAQYAVVSASSTFGAYVLTSFAKVPIDRAIPTTDPLHDWAIRLCSCLFGVLIILLATAVLHPLTGQSAFLAVTQGIEAGLSAIGTYHLLASNTGPATPLDPPAPPATSTAPSAPAASATMSAAAPSATPQAPAAPSAPSPASSSPSLPG